MCPLAEVAPVRERGLKYSDDYDTLDIPSRSRKGAWIEIPAYCLYKSCNRVAPVRERGLKFHIACNLVLDVAASLP